MYVDRIFVANSWYRINILSMESSFVALPTLTFEYYCCGFSKYFDRSKSDNSHLAKPKNNDWIKLRYTNVSSSSYTFVLVVVIETIRKNCVPFPNVLIILKRNPNRCYCCRRRYQYRRCHHCFVLLESFYQVY
jgi:hypothetical protein